MKAYPSRSGLAGLILLGIYLWGRDRTWMAHLGDALPILAGIPLFLFLSAPLSWQNVTATDRTGQVAVRAGAFLLGIGVLLNANFLLALGWTALFWAWLAPHLASDTRYKAARLLPLLVLSFPWLLQDGEIIGWWFRLSGAWATTAFYTLLGFVVQREGTLILIQGIAIGVDAPCAGLNVLQSLLLAGTALAFVSRGGKRWPLFPLLLVLTAMAWLANVLRILVLCAAALTYGIPFARGLFHTWGGLFALLVMFALCVALFSWEIPSGRKPAEGTK